MNTVSHTVRPDLAAEAESVLGRPQAEIFPTKDLQIMHYYLFPHQIFHAENIGGEIDQVLDQRVWIGCYPWRFKGGEAAFCRIVAYVEE